MSISLVPVVVAIIGLALFVFGPGKWSTVGDRLFFAGALAALMQGAHSCTIH
jgi:hypothetical protein